MGVPSYQHDIFVSYAELNNKAFGSLDKGWVTLLIQSLHQYIPMRSGRVVDIWARYLIPGQVSVRSYIEERVQKSATFLFVLSDAYSQDSLAKFEFDAILKQVKPDSGRIFVVEMSDVKRPSKLKPLNGYQFWEKDIRNRARTFGQTDPNDSHFFAGVQDLADDFSATLQNFPAIYATEPVEETDNINGASINGNDNGSPPANEAKPHTSSGNGSEQSTDEPESAYFLHLSDLHFGNETDAENWYMQLYQDLQLNLRFNEKKQLHGVVISGDIANYATKQEYQAAKIFLDKLSSAYALTPDQLIIVPGNHDVNWKTAQSAYKGPNKKLNPNEHLKRFEDFRDFYLEVKNRPYWLEYERQFSIDEFAKHKLLFAGFNSAHKLDHTNTEDVVIHTSALNQVIEHVLKDAKYNDYLKIAVWHHPLNNTTADRIKDQDFLERLAVAGFKVILHGHIHRTDSSLYTYDVISPESGRNLRTVGAGTFGAPPEEWTPGHPLQYNLLERQADKLIVHTRCREKIGGAWRPDPRWHGITKDGEEIYRAHYEIPL